MLELWLCGQPVACVWSVACGLCLENPAFPSREGGGTALGCRGEATPARSVTELDKPETPNWAGRRSRVSPAGHTAAHTLHAILARNRSKTKDCGSRAPLVTLLVTLPVDPTRLSRRLVSVLLSRRRRLLALMCASSHPNRHVRHLVAAAFGPGQWRTAPTDDAVRHCKVPEEKAKQQRWGFSGRCVHRNRPHWAHNPNETSRLRGDC